MRVYCAISASVNSLALLPSITSLTRSTFMWFIHLLHSLSSITKVNLQLSKMGSPCTVLVRCDIVCRGFIARKVLRHLVRYFALVGMLPLYG